jgi:hypothetical protein
MHLGMKRRALEWTTGRITWTIDRYSRGLENLVKVADLLVVAKPRPWIFQFGDEGRNRTAEARFSVKNHGICRAALRGYAQGDNFRRLWDNDIT